MILLSSMGRQEWGGGGGGVKRQKSGTAIGTKYTSFYADNFMDEVETEL